MSKKKKKKHIIDDIYLQKRFFGHVIYDLRSGKITLPNVFQRTHVRFNGL